MTHLHRFVSLLACCSAAVALQSCDRDEPFGPSQAASSVEKIAYVEKGRVFVDTGIGNPIAITERGYASPKWSPDGSRLAMRKDYRQIAVMGSDGANERIIFVAGDSNSVREIAWSPDGTQIAFVNHYFRLIWEGDQIVGEQDGSFLKLVNVVTKDVRELGEDLDLLCWPASSSSLFFTTNNIFPGAWWSHLHRLELGSSESTFLKVLPGGTVSVSPNGAMIAYTAHANGVIRIHTEDLSTGVNSVIHESTGQDGVSIIWSSDSREIAFVSGGGDIFTARSDGSQLTQRTTTGGPYVVYSRSPNGDYLAYTNEKVRTLRIFSLRENAAGPQMSLTNDLDILWANN